MACFGRVFFNAASFISIVFIVVFLSKCSISGTILLKQGGACKIMPIVQKIRGYCVLISGCDGKGLVSC